MPKPPKKFLWALIALLALTALLAARPRRPGPPLRLTVHGVASWEFDPYEYEDAWFMLKQRRTTTMETAVITLENVSASAVDMNFEHSDIPDFRPIGFTMGYHHVIPRFCGTGLEFGTCEPGYQRSWALPLEPGFPRELGFPLRDGRKQPPNFLEQELQQLAHTLRFAPDYQNMATSGPLPAPLPASAISFPTSSDLRQWASSGGTLWSVAIRPGQAIRRGDLDRVGSADFLLQLAAEMDWAREAGHTQCAKEIDGFGERKEALVVLDGQGEARAVLLATPDLYDRGSILTSEYYEEPFTPRAPVVLPVRHQVIGDYVVLHPLDCHPFYERDRIYLSTPCLFPHWRNRVDEWAER